ncbi:RagB/SusD family nutrient uptake outer membrane protein [uncultured Bacteroides sp.]|uniref:RagB/SusD family nutrient uptake outer membrane protein n=1 Tax=uncultured Bacteroides sp. TaxID=162156 RepID=UPI00033DD42A|nr:RagB/SusD family nutrient uptake outer membrane protein [uncultured Bacteroides sp.]CDA84695.1 susD family protein [Bacteroides sp. CAG:754]
MKTIKKLYKKILIAAFTLCNIYSCDYLNVSDELAGNLRSLDEVFDNVSYTRRWYANIFTSIPDYSGITAAVGNITGFKNPWAGMCDELTVGYGDAKLYNKTDKNASNMSFHRWDVCYKEIRQANIFLTYAKPIAANGTHVDVLTEEELTEMRANVRFMRAYYHYLLFEQYGAIPLIKDAILERDDNLDLPRNTIDEVISYLDEELTAVARELPQKALHDDDQHNAWPTKGVALAVKAKMWMYAASKLFNGEYKEALSITNPDGTRLFPDKNPDKWNKAVDALEEFMRFAEEEGNYELLKTGNPSQDLYDLFQTYNREIIWATAATSWGGMTNDMFDRRCTPRSEQNGMGCIGVTQELVDDFYMNDGLPVQPTSYLPQSPLYTTEGFDKYTETVKAGSKEIQVANNVSNRFLNREARFYNTVFFQNRRWHVTNNVTQFHKGSPNELSGTIYTHTGYMLYKRFNREVSMKSPGVQSKFRPSIIFRLADLYLLYAEAVNEVAPQDERVLSYLNEVRRRAGLSDIEELNPDIKGNQELQRLVIQRERRIELATEGQRYFDVRRWMIADQDGEGRQFGYVHGMNMNAAEDKFYEEVEASPIVFRRKMYLYPIPDNEMKKSEQLVQNPGW